MSTVIERGNKHNKPKKVKYRCSTCNSLIEFDKDDLMSDQQGELYVSCPVCESFIDAQVLAWGE